MFELFVWLAGSVLAWLAADGRGRSRWWSLLSWIGVAFVLVLPSRRHDPAAPTPETHVRCPECRELVRMDAKRCKHCGNRLVPNSAKPDSPYTEVELVEKLMAAVRNDDQEGFNLLLAHGVPAEAVGRIIEYADLYGREYVKAAMMRGRVE
ncbi:zinc ribbon domain-containing protein [Chromobacterium amazonense]|uniref:zinc ribbon domain-containing protein n=1 Tax=Chromobacterium amazonense TaxID=1382803 RepID=UPI0011B29ECF|nr:zinc ribbon domain-containing protein [Chromobacterium amazonense]